MTRGRVLLLAGLLTLTLASCESSDKVGVLFVAGGATGSGGTAPDVPDGGGGSAGTAGDGSVTDGTQTVAPLCGGEVHTTGTGSLALDAHYIDLRYVGSDCPEHLTIVAAEAAGENSLSITIEVYGTEASGSLLGRSTAIASVFFPGAGTIQMGADVEITSFPDNARLGAAHGGGPVTGTFKILRAGEMLDGSFSSPLCSALVCLP